MRKRITYLDSAKAILILLVIFGHIYKITDISFLDVQSKYKEYFLIRDWVYSFHMPAFFILSGITLKTDKPFSLYVVQKIKRLLIPYFIAEIVSAFLLITVCGYKKLTLTDYLINFLILRSSTTVNWFLVALFFAEIIVFSLKKTHMVFKLGFAVFAVIFTYYCTFSYSLLFIGRIAISAMYVLLGTEIKGILDKLMEYKFLLVWGLISAVSYVYLTNVDLYYGQLSHPVFYVLGGISGTMIVVTVAKFADNKIFEWIGRNTLTIMLTHMLIILFVQGRINPPLTYFNMTFYYFIVLIVECLVIIMYGRIKKSNKRIIH